MNRTIEYRIDNFEILLHSQMAFSNICWTLIKKERCHVLKIMQLNKKPATDFEKMMMKW